jgi:hypothetical protein
MGEILQRLLDNLMGRPTGPLGLRLLIQPCVAIFFAVRSGLKDAREGRPAFFWGVLFKPGHRDELLHQGWKDVGVVFVIAMLLDAIYQLMVHRGVYVLEVLITATVLAIVPYFLVRGPVNRIARRLLMGKQVTAKAGDRFE